MIWPLKLSPTASPLASLSPKNFKTVSIWRFLFQKTGHFRQILEAVVAFCRLFAKKSLAAPAAASAHYGLWSRVFNLFFSETN
jgi:hypothetical protein